MAEEDGSSKAEKKALFRQYCDQCKVTETINKVLEALYEEPEKPANAIEYIKKHIGTPLDIDIDKLQIEFNKLKEDNTFLKAQVSELKKQIEEVQNPQEQQQEDQGEEEG